MKRDATDLSILDPVKVESFIFGDPSDDKPKFNFANMTVLSPDEQRVLSLERFGSKLKSLECSKETVLTFKNKKAFNYAVKAWDWVNHHKTHRFLLVSDHPNCANAEERQPYLVTDTESNADKLAVHLTGEKKNWADVLGDVNIVTGVVEHPHASPKRWTKDFGTFDLNADFDGLIFDAKPVATLECFDCIFRGVLEVSLIAEFRNFIPTRADLVLKPRGMLSDTWMKADVTETMGPFAYLKLIELASKPLPKIGKKTFKLPGIKGAFGGQGMATIMMFACLFEFDTDGTLSFGARGRVSDSSIITMDLLKFGLGEPPMQHAEKPIDVINPFPPGTFHQQGYHLDTQWKPAIRDFKEEGQGYVSYGFLLDIGFDLVLFDWKIGVGAFWNAIKYQENLNFANLPNQEPDSICNKLKTPGASYQRKSGADLMGRISVGGNPSDVLSLVVNSEALYKDDKRSLEDHDVKTRSVNGTEAENVKINRGKRSLERRDSAENPSTKGTDPVKLKKGEKLPFTASLALIIADWKKVATETCLKDDTPPPQGQKPPPAPGRPEACTLIDDGVRTRECPDTTEKCPTNGQYARDAMIRFDCQADGEPVDGHKAWGKTKEKNPRIKKWMSLKYVDSKCQATIPRCPLPPANPDQSCFVNKEWGVCKDVEACKHEGKVPLEGVKDKDGKWPCEGGPNIWCCPLKKSGLDGVVGNLLPPPPNTQQGCKVDGRNGDCMDTEACLKQNKDPLPGKKDPKTGKWPCEGKTTQCCAAKLAQPPPPPLPFPPNPLP